MKHVSIRRLVLPLALVAARAAAYEPVDIVDAGRVQYQRSCAVCHGSEGRGDGPLAAFLTRRPADLTRLGANNGGTFPFGRIYDVIDGREELGAHGTREMPVWGAAWKEAAPEGFGETWVRGRILEIIIYLRAIQEPPPR